MNTKIQPTTKYKNSPLGLIPGDWEVMTLKDVCLKIQDGNYGGDYPKADEFIDFGIPFLTSKAIGGSGELIIKKVDYISLEKHNKLKKAHLKLNDILFTNRGANVGTIGIVDDRIAHGNIGPQLTLLRSNSERIYFDYLKAAMKSFLVQNQVKSQDSGSAMNFFGIGETSKFKLCVPPLPEQKAIADCLSTWDKAIEKQNALITQKELSKKALMQQLLSGKKRLKGFSGKWHLKSLEEVAAFRNGKAHENCIDENGEFKVINSKFVSTNGTVFKSSNENLCPLFVNEIAMVMSDIPNGRALAKCFYVDENNKYTLNQRICAIRANDKTDSKFLYYILNRNVHYLSFDNGVGQTNLKREEVLECPLLMPEKEEQTAIANLLQCADDELQLLKKKLEQLKEQKKGLMQVLLTGKKRLGIKQTNHK